MLAEVIQSEPIATFCNLAAGSLWPLASAYSRQSQCLILSVHIYQYPSPPFTVDKRGRNRRLPVPLHGWQGRLDSALGRVISFLPISSAPIGGRRA